MKQKKYPITRTLAQEVCDLHDTPEWETPWNKIKEQHPELKAHTGKLLLIIDHETGFCFVTVGAPV